MAAASESKRSSSVLLDDVVTSPALPYQSNGAGKAAWYSYGKPFIVCLRGTF